MRGERRKIGLWLDPRSKLFLILICVLASMFAPSLAYQFALVVLIAILGHSSENGNMSSRQCASMLSFAF